MNDNQKDTRIVYGASCLWWDSIDKVGKRDIANGVSLPCCPHCRGVLYEIPDSQSWWSAVDKHDATHSGYRGLIEWARGRCFKTVQQATAVYKSETGRTVKL
jgi:hypothetical protein